MSAPPEGWSGMDWTPSELISAKSKEANRTRDVVHESFHHDVGPRPQFHMRELEPSGAAAE